MGRLTPTTSGHAHSETTTTSANGAAERSSVALATRTTGQILDVLSGRRPLHHIRHWLSGPVSGLLATMLRSGRTTTARYRLRSVHTCPVTAHTVEACAVITDNERVRALTMRLEQHKTQWSCTLLALL